MTGHLSAAPASTDVLSAKIVTLAERLQAAGYHTLGFSGNPFLIEPFGFAQGFDRFEFFPGGDFATANQIVSAALVSVKRSSPKPLFLWLHLMEPHSPYAPPPWTIGTFRGSGGAPVRLPVAAPAPAWLLNGSPNDLRRYEEAYDEEILAVDTAVGTLLRGIDEVRDASRTVVALTADHGEQFLDHGGWEHSDQLYDELIRVPLMIKAPGEPRRTVDAQVELLDVYPTLLDYAGVDLPSDVPGRSLAGGEPVESEPAFSEIAGSQYAVRTDEWKLIVGADIEPRLFDLRVDPHEHHNAAGRHPAELDRLMRLCDRWLTSSMASGRGILPETAVVSARVLDRLRALGYIAR
jgi:arylsulfatase A-like enzyme